MMTVLTAGNAAPDFSAADQNDATVSLADFKGKVVAIFFGYVYCPEVCPTVLAELAGTMKRLGTDAGRVQVLFITVDPERDTPQLLAQYAPAFDPSFLALYGTLEQTKETAKEFKVFFQKEPGHVLGNFNWLFCFFDFFGGHCKVCLNH